MTAILLGLLVSSAKSSFGRQFDRAIGKLVSCTLLPCNVELFFLAQDPSEENNVAAQHPDKVAASQQRLDELAKPKRKANVPRGPIQVVTKGLRGEPVLPIDEDFAGIENSLASQPTRSDRLARKEAHHLNLLAWAG
jgi:hypothetical protein